MISRLKGSLVEKTPSRIIVDVGIHAGFDRSRTCVGVPCDDGVAVGAGGIVTPELRDSSEQNGGDPTS